MKINKAFLIGMIALVAASETLAVQTVSLEAEKALGVEFSRTPSGGKLSIPTGLIFANGRFIKPSYRVERRGNAIFVNGVQIPGKGVEWTEFIKTQEGVERHEETITPAPVVEAVEEPEPEPAPEEEVASDDDISLDDLFDDNPKPKKTKKPAVAKKKPRKPVVRKPVVVVTYSFDGQFKANEKTRQLVEGINVDRKRIENLLKADRFVFLGDGYSQVTGGANDLLEKLPELMKRAQDAKELFRLARNAGMLYLSELICEDLMHYKTGYIELQSIKKARQDEQELKELIGG